MRAHSRRTVAALAASCLVILGAAPASTGLLAGASEVPGARTIPVEDLPAAVTIDIDEWGVPHVSADDPASMAYGFGYAQASERLFLMDVIRRIAQGRLSELLGDGAYPADVVMRREFYEREDFDRQLAALPEQIQLLLERYADGVNRAIAETLANPMELPAVYAALGDAPQPWTAHDSVSVLNLFTAVSFAAEGEGGELENLDRYVALRERYGQDADAIWQDLWGGDPEITSVIPDEDAPPVPDGVREVAPPHDDQLALAQDPGSLGEVAGILREQLARARDALDQVPVPKVGSYAAALSGERTASGGALLLGAPQAGMTFPSTFHEVGIHVPGWDCQGMTVPGLGPFVGIGWCNGHAWTLVAGNAGDQVDVYVETLDPADPGRYVFQGDGRAFEERTERFLVKSTLDGQLDVREETFRYTVHGAVFHEDRDAGVAYTTRRAQDGRSVQNLEGLYLLNTAEGGVAEVMASRDLFTASYNLVVADDTGSIGYTFTGLQPVRAPGYDHRFAMPGTGEAEWSGFIPAGQMPHVQDPASGILVVNQGVESKPVHWWPSSSSLNVGRVNRVESNRDLMSTSDDWDLVSLQRIDRSLIEAEEPFVARFAQHIDAAFRGAERDPRYAELRDIWEDWKASGFARTDEDADGSYDQAGAAVFQLDRYYGMPASPLWEELYRRTVGAHLPAGHGWGHYFARMSLLERALDGDRGLAMDYVDDPSTRRRERGPDQVRAALDAALPQLAQRYGNDRPSEWRLPVTEIRFDVAGISGPRPMRVMDHGTYNYIVDLAARRGVSILPPGNGSADTLVAEGRAEVTGELPPHADDQLELYERWQHKPMHRLDHAAHTEHTIVLVPSP